MTHRMHAVVFQFDLQKPHFKELNKAKLSDTQARGK